MENCYNQSIQSYLRALYPHVPLASDLLPRTEPSMKVKAIIFDIYGTLLLSTSGYTDQSDAKSLYVENALIGASLALNHDFIRSAFSLYKAEIKRVYRVAHKQGVTHPEIDVVAVWRQVFYVNKIRICDEQIRQFAFVFEIQNNPVYPMPGMVRVLESLVEAGIPIGIVSNAQFYTVPIMNHFICGNSEKVETVELFDADLSSFSFEQHYAKPDIRLFKKVSRVLHDKYNIKPQEALFVGNDMFRDIYPAQKGGFKTVLYAGDKRTLRLRKEHRNVIGLVPDYIITHLNQIFDIMK